MHALATSYIFWILLIFGLLALYALPTVIAAIRGVQGLGWIIVINLLPTGVGWLAALIAAVALPGRDRWRLAEPAHPAAAPAAGSSDRRRANGLPASPEPTRH